VISKTAISRSSELELKDWKAAHILFKYLILQILIQTIKKSANQEGTVKTTWSTLTLGSNDF